MRSSALSHKSQSVSSAGPNRGVAARLTTAPLRSAKSTSLFSAAPWVRHVPCPQQRAGDPGLTTSQELAHDAVHSFGGRRARPGLADYLLHALGESFQSLLQFAEESQGGLPSTQFSGQVLPLRRSARRYDPKETALPAQVAAHPATEPTPDYSGHRPGLRMSTPVRPGCRALASGHSRDAHLPKAPQPSSQRRCPRNHESPQPDPDLTASLNSYRI